MKKIHCGGWGLVKMETRGISMPHSLKQKHTKTVVYCHRQVLAWRWELLVHTEVSHSRRSAIL